MSTTAEPPLPQPRIDINEESRLFGWTGTDWTELSVDGTGQLETALSDALQSAATDELRVRAFGPDAGGTLRQVNAEQFDSVLATTDVGLATYGARALQSLAQDELRSRIHDSAGAQIDPATTALENALQANAADEFRARLHDATGVQIDPLNQDVLQTVGADELRARVFGPDAGGSLRQVLAEQLDTGVAATDVGLLTWVARALNSIGADELVARTADSAGVQQDLQQADSAFENATAIAAGATVENLLQAPGADSLEGRVVVDQPYDIDVEWQDDTGNTLFTATIASGVAADTETPINEPDLESPNANVVVTNTSANPGSLTATLHMG